MGLRPPPKPPDRSYSFSESMEPPADLLMPLLPYQKQFLAWAMKQEKGPVRGGILADEMVRAWGWGFGSRVSKPALVTGLSRLLQKSSWSPQNSVVVRICPAGATPPHPCTS
jgi:hypothetical protein